MPATDLSMDDVLAALANPARRQMLRLAGEAERPASELAAGVGLSRSAASQHLKILLDSHLVDVRSNGRHRHYRARRQTLEAVLSYLDDFWGDRLTALKRATEARA